jgi:acetylxylan esterase
MRGFLTTTISVLAATATAASSNTTCATGLYILCARGSGEPDVAPPKANLTLNTGSPGILANAIANKISGSVIAGVAYPATNPFPANLNLSDPTALQDLNLTSYYLSENAGASAILEEVNQYHSSCPDSKIALLGYSQVCPTRIELLC